MSFRNFFFFCIINIVNHATISLLKYRVCLFIRNFHVSEALWKTDQGIMIYYRRILSIFHAIMCRITCSNAEMHRLVKFTGGALCDESNSSLLSEICVYNTLSSVSSVMSQDFHLMCRGLVGRLLCTIMVIARSDSLSDNAIRPL